MISSRFELKYLISYYDYLQLRKTLKKIMRHDQHGTSERYPVNSIYFDDLFYNGAQDKLFGNERHEKFRIRYYDDDKKLKFECKERLGHYSTKYSRSLSLEQKDAILTGRIFDLMDILEDEVISKYVLKHKLDYLKPTFFVSYEREAYHTIKDDVRITFDFDLHGIPYGLEGSGYMPKHSLVICEIKYRHVLPKLYKDLFTDVGFTEQSYSKYSAVLQHYYL
jgi:hypothetical protein